MDGGGESSEHCKMSNRAGDEGEGRGGVGKVKGGISARWTYSALKNRKIKLRVGEIRVDDNNFIC